MPPALSARLLGQMPQGSSLDALASLAAFSAELVDHAGFWISQDKMGFPEALDMSLQAAQVHQARALSAEIDRRAQVLVQSYLQRVAPG